MVSLIKTDRFSLTSLFLTTVTLLLTLPSLLVSLTHFTIVAYALTPLYVVIAGFLIAKLLTSSRSGRLSIYINLLLVGIILMADNALIGDMRIYYIGLLLYGASSFGIYEISRRTPKVILNRFKSVFIYKGIYAVLLTDLTQQGTKIA